MVLEKRMKIGKVYDANEQRTDFDQESSLGGLKRSYMYIDVSE